jgi:hypothetical protein
MQAAEDAAKAAEQKIAAIRRKQVEAKSAAAVEVEPPMEAPSEVELDIAAPTESTPKRRRTGGGFTPGSPSPCSVPPPGAAGPVNPPQTSPPKLVGSSLGSHRQTAGGMSSGSGCPVPRQQPQPTSMLPESEDSVCGNCGDEMPRSYLTKYSENIISCAECKSSANRWGEQMKGNAKSKGSPPS